MQRIRITNRFAPSSAKEHNGFGAPFFFNFISFFNNDLSGLIPRNLLPFIFTAIITGTFHRVTKAIRMLTSAYIQGVPYRMCASRLEVTPTAAPQTGPIR